MRGSESPANDEKSSGSIDYSQPSSLSTIAPRRREDKRGRKEVHEPLSITNEMHEIRRRLGKKSGHTDD
jgi:hypothetical protein